MPGLPSSGGAHGSADRSAASPGQGAARLSNAGRRTKDAGHELADRSVQQPAGQIRQQMEAAGVIGHHRSGDADLDAPPAGAGQFDRVRLVASGYVPVDDVASSS